MPKRAFTSLDSDKRVYPSIDLAARIFLTVRAGKMTIVGLKRLDEFTWI